MDFPKIALPPWQMAPGYQQRKRARYRSARSFYLILATITVLAACALLREYHNGYSATKLLYSRDLTTLAAGDDDDSCRLVHSARNQCKFIKKHCPTDEAGFSAYLDLYYCQLPRLKPVSFILLSLWLALLFSTIGIAASDFFCVDLSTMAKVLGMSESMAGVTLLAFGNGSPDVFSTFAAMGSGSGDLAVGELMGAAGFITAVVTGSMALIKPFKVSKRSFIRDVCFFTVAAAFTMYILSDGILHLWECLAMVAFYIFYVIFVVVWHWWVGRRRRQRQREAAAREHFIHTGDGHVEEEQTAPYADDPDERLIQPGISRGTSREDFAALERGATPEIDGREAGDGEIDDEERDRWMSELNTNMRLSRPAARSRSSTIAPVRPSLVGALEFQSVLKSLQKSRNMQSYAMGPRRYSDDAFARTLQQVNEEVSGVHSNAQPNIQQDKTSRGRAVSIGEPPLIRIDPEIPRQGDDLLIAGGTADERSKSMHAVPTVKHHVSFKPSNDAISQRSLSPNQDPAASTAVESPGHTPRLESAHPHRKLLGSLNGPHKSPQMTHRQAQVVLPSPPGSRASPRISHTKHSPMPHFHDETAGSPATPLPQLVLPPPVVDVSPDPTTVDQDADDLPELQPRARKWRWWPYRLLPPPEILGCVLFPTLTDWNDKGIWAKLLAVVAAPSVFLLTVSLPVVESEDDDGEPGITQTGLSIHEEVPKAGGIADGSPDVRRLPEREPLTSGTTGLGSAATVAVSAEEEHRHHHHQTYGTLNESGIPSLTPGSRTTTFSEEALIGDYRGDPSSQARSTSNTWPRWLLLIQLYVAPMSVILAVFFQSPTPLPPRWLLRPSLFSILISSILLIPVLLTTTPTHRPKPYQWMLSLAGFVVSLAWISTIASQVVGTLKALAVILNWSNAIMGLTIFAVGNSISDLVADVTVANLGYPVMALSACFGGPMLNILLGIGLSGTYHILRGADKRKHKHPEKGYKMKSYHLDVGQTLVVSGITLLITLVGVLILVPLNRWVLSRKIGILLITIWVIATIGNVVLEVTGFAAVSNFG